MAEAIERHHAVYYYMIRVSKNKSLDIVERWCEDIFAEQIAEMHPEGWRPHTRFTSFEEDEPLMAMNIQLLNAVKRQVIETIL